MYEVVVPSTRKCAPVVVGSGARPLLSICQEPCPTGDKSMTKGDCTDGPWAVGQLFVARLFRGAVRPT